jgi:hypothetical protein
MKSFFVIGRLLFQPASNIISVLSLLMLLVGCSATINSISPSTTTISPSDLHLSSLYFGQKPPGLKAEIFAPGIVSDPLFSEYSGTFSPDGREYYFYRFSANSPSRLFFSKMLNDQWTTPEPFAFSTEYGASEPLLTPDNQRLYFMWEYPVPPGQPGYNQEIKYYFVERNAKDWSTPQYAGQGMFLSSSRDGQLFITDMSSLKTDGRTNLARVTTDNGIFTEYEKLNVPILYGNPAHPCIAPDGNFILFDVSEGCHLFVSFIKDDGTWEESIDLTEHGFDPLAGGAYVSPDGKYLFFGLNDDIWWVDIKTIESLKPIE